MYSLVCRPGYRVQSAGGREGEQRDLGVGVVPRLQGGLRPRVPDRQHPGLGPPPPHPGPHPAGRPRLDPGHQGAAAPTLRTAETHSLKTSFTDGFHKTFVFHEGFNK